MKKLLSGLVLAAFSLWASATTLNPVQLLNPAGSSSGQAIVSTGASSAPAWGGVGVNGIAAIAANTVLANATGSSASPTAFAMPSCTGASNALGYTSGTGIVCNSAVNAATLSGNAVGTSGAKVPLLNGANTWSAAQTFSALISPSSTIGIAGTVAADNANAGSIGEFITATGTGVSLTNNTTSNVTSITLTAGDWDVSGNTEFVAAPSTIISIAQTAVTTTSLANGGAGIRGINSSTQQASNNISLVAPVQRINVSTSTTVYLTAWASFSASTLSATGIIRARRIR
jgi:hypothetical protein